MAKFLAFLGLLFLATQASAEDFYWKATTHATHYASIAAACEGARVRNNTTYGEPYDFRLKRIDFLSETQRSCFFDVFLNGSMYNNDAVEVNRLGDACAPGATYNTTTGACDAPQAAIGELCTDQTGGTTRDPKIGQPDGSCKNVTQSATAAKCQYWAKNRPSKRVTFRVTDWQKEAGSSTSPSPGFIGEKNGCEIQVLEGSKCTYEPPRPSYVANPDGTYPMEPGVHRCTADVIVTGNVFNGSNADPAGLECLLNPDACVLPDPTTQKDTKPCSYAWDTDGQRGTCQSAQVEWQTEGEACDYVGSVNGQTTCVGKKPTSNGIIIDTEIKTTANADGTTTQTKTDKATQTICNGSGVQSCSTHVTNNKTTVVKNGDGTTKSESATCTGANCPTGTNPDGNGDGLGDCVGDTCGEDEGGEYAPAVMPELEETDEIGEATSAYYARIRSAPIVQALTSISVPSGGTCPAGTAQTFFGPISFDSFCQLAPQVLAGLVWLFRAIWAWAAIRLFFTA